MPSTSPVLGLNLYDTTEADRKVYFMNFRTAIAGSQTSSNFMILDTAIGNLQTEMEEVRNAPSITYAYCQKLDDTTYVSTVADLTEYRVNMLMILSLDEPNAGIVSVDINDLGAVYLKRHDNDGGLLDILAGDLSAGRNYLVRYDGNYFILLSPVYATDFIMPGVSGNILSISGSNRLEDSGISLEYIRNKIDRVADATEGNLVSLAADGSLVDAGDALGSYATKQLVEDSYIPNVESPTAGNLAAVDENGHVVDSGKTIGDFDAFGSAAAVREELGTAKEELQTQHDTLKGEHDALQKQVDEHMLDLDNPHEVTTGQIGAARVSTVVNIVIPANGWVEGVCTLDIASVTATSNQEILPALEITNDELKALQSANIQDGGQAVGNIMLKAFGKTPEIDIPIRVILRGDA